MELYQAGQKVTRGCGAHAKDSLLQQQNAARPHVFVPSAGGARMGARLRGVDEVTAQRGMRRCGLRTGFSPMFLSSAARTRSAEARRQTPALIMQN